MVGDNSRGPLVTPLVANYEFNLSQIECIKIGVDLD